MGKLRSYDGKTLRNRRFTVSSFACLMMGVASLGLSAPSHAQSALSTSPDTVETLEDTPSTLNLSLNAPLNDKALDKMPKDLIPPALLAAPAIDLEQFNLSPYFSLSPTLDTALVPLPPQILGGSDITADFSAVNCLSGQELCGPRFDSAGLDISKAINTDKPGGIDLQLIPRAAINFSDQHSSALVGAVVKIGEDLRELDPNDNTRWYVFAGADAEAVTFSTKGQSRLTASQFNLQDRIIVGDAQAGFGYKIGDADIALTYIRRDVNSFGLEPGDDAVSYREDAAALSLTWRR